MNKEKKYTISICVVLAVFFVCSVYYYTVIKQPFDYVNELDTWAIRIDGDELTLRDLGYYALIVEKRIDDMAKVYDEDVNEFWNLHFRAGEDSSFLRSKAKETMQEIAIYDYIMEREMQEFQVELSEEEIMISESEALEFYDALLETEIVSTGVTHESVRNILVNEAKICAYVAMKKEALDKEGIHISYEQIAYYGDYYIEEIRSKYNIEINKKIWDDISMGNIINY